jgi:hypothetical protein
MKLRKSKPDADILHTESALKFLGPGRIRGWYWSHQLTGWFWAKSPTGDWYRSVEMVRPK